VPGVQTVAGAACCIVRSTTYRSKLPVFFLSCAA